MRPKGRYNGKNPARNRKSPIMRNNGKDQAIPEKVPTDKTPRRRRVPRQNTRTGRAPSK